MTVCVTGMHRSGTSMIARLLNLCGLYLGPPDRIVPPGEGNPLGFWENQDMDRLNEDLLAHLAGGWDFLLPPITEGWESDPGLSPLRDRANRLIQALGQHEPWGWKDPRCSLTLPFWKSLLPGLKVIVCLRHPLEVVRSLKKRVGGTTAFNFNLYLKYYQRILADTAPEERLFTHFDRYFLDPQEELQRIVQWLGWPVTPGRIDQACAAIATPSRQHRLAGEADTGTTVPTEVAELYAELCTYGGDGLLQAMEQGALPRPTQVPVKVPRLPAADSVAEGAKAEAESHFNRAQERIASSQFGDALTALTDAVALNPLYSQAHNDLGVLYHRDGDADRALGHLTLATQLDPDAADTARNLAEVYVEVGRTEDAIQIYLRLIERHPNDLDALLWLAAAATKLGQKPQATAFLQRVLENQPGHQAAKDLLAGL